MCHWYCTLWGWNGNLSSFGDRTCGVALYGGYGPMKVSMACNWGWLEPEGPIPPAGEKKGPCPMGLPCRYQIAWEVPPSPSPYWEMLTKTLIIWLAYVCDIFKQESKSFIFLSLFIAPWKSEWRICFIQVNCKKMGPVFKVHWCWSQFWFTLVNSLIETDVRSGPGTIHLLCRWRDKIEWNKSKTRGISQGDSESF